MIIGMVTSPGQPMEVLDDTEGVLFAGFLYSSGSCGETKKYALFAKESPVGNWVFVRHCAGKEVRRIAKILYFHHTVRPVRTALKNGDTCALFIGL